MITKDSIPNQKRTEEVLLHLRRHWFIFFRVFIFFLFLCFVPLVLYLFINYNFPSLFQSEIITGITLIMIFTYYLIMFAFIFTLWTETYLDVWTVTTERIINREQHGLFNREVSELDLYRIQDVTAEQKGLLPTIFHYGNVYIQSAGAKERFTFEQIPNPYKVGKMIQKLDERSKHQHNIESNENNQPNPQK